MVSFADKQIRLKDEFFLTAQARPATAEHYLAWLESYLDTGGAMKGMSLQPFPESTFYTISHDAATPVLEGSFAFNIIVPPGVKLIPAPVATNCASYIVEDGTARNDKEIYIWREMLDAAINDGYPLSRLVSAADLGACAQAAVIEKITGFQAGTKDYYDAFALDAKYHDVERMIAALRAYDVTQVTREFLKIEVATPIDAASQAVIDEKAGEAMKTLEVLRYKLDPASTQPIAAFGKRAKPPPEPNIELPGQIQVGPVLRLKDPVGP